MSDGDKPRTPPIVEPGFIAGVSVVDIGDLRIARGLTRRPYSACQHVQLVYDGAERRIWCKDCETDVEPFDAFRMLVERFDAYSESLKKREMRVEEIELFKVRSLAARELDKAWRSKNMVPACPHCGNGLFPESFKSGGFALLGKDYADARIARDKDRSKP